MLTVLLATRNRAQILREVLEAYCHLQVPISGWKVVVVDNASTDQTQEILASLSSRLPLRSVREPRVGKNFALNTGLNYVEGDLVVLTDDDVFPAPEWLISLRKAADEQPDFAMFGGVVLARWAVSPPAWVPWVDIGAVYTISKSSLREGPIEPHDIFGPNMAVRACVFQTGTRFDPTIGPSGSSYAMGSETELVLRLRKQGFRAWFVQGAVVEHYIRKEQLELSWVLQRGVRFGRGQYRLYGQEKNVRARSRMGIPLHLFRRALKHAVLAVFPFIFRRAEAMFQARWRLNFVLGQIQEARILERERRAQEGSVHMLAATRQTSRRP
jgi:glycosyltransferase involved in cell wall biosynthesis